MTTPRRFNLDRMRRNRPSLIGWTELRVGCDFPAAYPQTTWTHWTIDKSPGGGMVVTATRDHARNSGYTYAEKENP